MASGSPTVNKIDMAHQMYREGKYTEALGYYTDALSMAKAKPQKIALHSNRAACYLKLHDFKKAAEECTSVLELDQNHTGALMLRAQTLVTLKEYHSALFDVNRLIELNPSSEMYRNLQARLKTQLPLAPIPEDEAELEEDDHSASDETELEEKEDEREGIKEVVECKNKEENMIDAAAENEKINDITELGASRNYNIKKNPINNLDGRQSQNRKDTLTLTTPDGTWLNMTLLKKKKKKKTKMRMKILSLSIDFVLKLWVLRQSNKFPEDRDNCLNSHLDSILKVKLIWDEMHHIISSTFFGESCILFR